MSSPGDISGPVVPPLRSPSRVSSSRLSPPLAPSLVSFLHPPPTAVDAWNAEDAFPFNVTSFALQYDGFDVAAESTGATSALDAAGGRVHAYRSVAYTVDSLMERAAIPSMIAAGVLPPDGVPSLADLAARASAPRDDEDGGAVFLEPAYNLSAIMAHITTPRELVLVATGPGPGPGDADPRRASLGFFALATRRESRSNGWKACKYQHAGAYAAGMCTTYAALEEICVKVRQNDDGAWGVDDTHGGVGCDPNTRWEPAKWRRVRAPGVGKDPAFSTTRSAGGGFGGFAVGKRSAHRREEHHGRIDVLRGGGGGEIRRGDHRTHRRIRRRRAGRVSRVAVRVAGGARRRGVSTGKSGEDEACDGPGRVR